MALESAIGAEPLSERIWSLFPGARQRSAERRVGVAGRNRPAEKGGGRRLSGWRQARRPPPSYSSLPVWNHVERNQVMRRHPERGLTGNNDEQTFSEIVCLIAESRENAVRSINTVLIDLYWTVGEIISRKIASAEWGDAVVPKQAAYIARTQPGLRGFTRANLFRMRQFYEAYRNDEKVAPLVRQSHGRTTCLS